MEALRRKLAGQMHQNSSFAEGCLHVLRKNNRESGLTLSSHLPPTGDGFTVVTARAAIPANSSPIPLAAHRFGFSQEAISHYG